MKSPILKFRQYLILLLSLTGIAFLLPELYAESLFVDKIGIESVNRTTNWTFTVESPLFLTNSQWLPEKNQYPTNLGEQIAKNASYVAHAKHITNALEISWVSLRHLTLPKRQFLAGGQIENTWFLETVFYLSDYGSDEKAAVTALPVNGAAVSFLDGTFAKEEPFENQKKIVPGTLPSHDEPSKTTLPAKPKRHEATGENPYDKLLQSNFQLSTVTWNAFRDPFPMDIPKEIEQCKQFLSNQSLTFTNLHLKEIQMTPFAFDVQIAHGLDSSSARIHWLTTFEFVEQSALRKQFRVNTLLDGRIIGFSEYN